MAANIPVPTLTPSDTGSASWINTYLRDNMALTGLGLVTTKGDLTPASASKTLVRMAAGSDYDLPYYLAAESGGMATGSAGRMWKITDTLLSADTATIDFTSIPQTFTHLKIIGSTRTDNAAAFDSVRCRVNDDSTADRHAFCRLLGFGGAAAGSDWVTDETSWIVSSSVGATAAASMFATFEMTIADYANTSKGPQFVSHNGASWGVAGSNINQDNWSGIFNTAGAVTRLTFFPRSGSNLADKTRITLYGIR